MRPVSACLGQEVRLLWTAMFGGLSPLRGPLAAGAAEKENSETAFGDARGNRGRRLNLNQARHDQPIAARSATNTTAPPPINSIGCNSGRQVSNAQAASATAQASGPDSSTPRITKRPEIIRPAPIGRSPFSTAACQREPR